MMFLFLPIFFLLQIVHWIGFFLDDIFFRGYRNVEVKEPLFIVGVPRSGTTFLHRVLANDTEQFTTFTLWELLFAPSVTERMFWIGLGKLDRIVGSPFARLIAWIERVFFRQIDGIHRISLCAPEEDYFTLVPIFACLLLILPFPFPEELMHLGYFDDQTPPADKKRIMAFYKSCLQRHLYVRGPEKRLLSKNVAFSPMIKTLNETFPDCKVICNMRNPFFVVPSLLSSMMSGAQIFDNDTQGDVFRDQLLGMLRYFYKHLAVTLPNWPQNRHMFVTMDELQDNVQEMIKEIYSRFGYTITPSFEKRLQMEYRQARKYTSTHKYSLEQFEIQPETLAKAFAYVFEQFEFAAPITNTQSL